MIQKGNKKNNPGDETCFIKWFSELNKDSGTIAGEKGANLSEIYNLKFPVPPGFIISSQAYEYFIENSGLTNLIKGQLEKINYQNENQLKDISEVIRNNIIEAKMPNSLEEEIIEAYETLSASDLSEVYGSALDILQNAHEPIFVAVRSSPKSEDFNEKPQSFLNIKGIYQLIEYVKRCFASLFTPHAIIFRNKHGLEPYPSEIAIVVQKMVDSTKSGIILSKDISNKENNIIIKSIWGLGEGMSFEEINPDEYTLNRNLEITNVKEGEKKIAITRDSSGNKTAIRLREEKSRQQTLTKSEIIKLSQLALNIEEYYKKPQEIEFAIEGEDIYLVQTKEIEEIIEAKESEEDNKIEEKLPEEENLEEENTELIEESPETEKKQKMEIQQTKTKVKLIMGPKEIAENYLETNKKSIGLIRIEEIISKSGKHPNYFIETGNIQEYEEIIFQGVRKISENFNEIWVKNSDIKSDELLSLEGSPKEKETNPKMGLHGIRFLLKNAEILKAELNALKRISQLGKKIVIIIPNITLIDEIRKFKEILDEIEFNEAKVGVSIETPSAVQLINQICDENLELVTIGINCLTQNILSIDRENPEVKEMYDELNPAVLYQISYVIRVCRRKNIESNIYTYNEANKELIKFLIENEINSISISPEYAEELTKDIKELEDILIKGTDKEPRKYIPKEGIREEILPIKGIEKLNNHKDQE